MIAGALPPAAVVAPPNATTVPTASEPGQGETAFDAFARLIGLLQSPAVAADAAAAEPQAAPAPAETRVDDWVRSESAPAELWASIWFPPVAASPPPVLPPAESPGLAPVPQPAAAVPVPSVPGEGLDPWSAPGPATVAGATTPSMSPVPTATESTPVPLTTAPTSMPKPAPTQAPAGTAPGAAATPAGATVPDAALAAPDASFAALLVDPPPAEPLPADAPATRTTVAESVRVELSAAVPLATAAPAPRVDVASPPAPPAALDLHGPRLPDQLGQAVVWSLGEQLSEVSLEVNPGELGPLSLQLRLEDERVSLRIGVTQAAVAEVVQGSLGTLAGLLQARGLHLEQAQVYAQTRPPTPAVPTRGQASSEGVSLIQTPRVIRRRGLIDDFV